MKKILSFFMTINLFAISFVTTSCSIKLETPTVVAFASDDYRDGSFRQNIYDGMKQASSDSEWLVTQGNSTSIYMKAYRTYFVYGTEVIVAAGADEREAVQQSSAIYQDKRYILVDEEINWESTNKNYTGIFYEVEKASFVTGYLLGMYVQENWSLYQNRKEIYFSGWGGADYTGVNNYLTGFRQGLDYFNFINSENDSPTLKFVLFDERNRMGNYSGGFSPGANNAKDTTIAQGLVVDKKVDFMLPVAASQTKTALTVSKMYGNSKVKVIGVDSDQRSVYPDDQNLIITSILKNSEKTVKEAVESALNIDENWDSIYGGQTYYANAINEGVGYIDIPNLSEIPDFVLEQSEKTSKHDAKCDWATSGDGWCSLEDWK